MHRGYLLDLIPEKTAELLEKLGAHGASLDMRTYAVGGIVRDLILERKLSDIDITVEGIGIDFARSYVNEYGGAYYSFPKFGTATMITTDRIRIDVATARTEAYPVPGALPIVSDSTLRNDLHRRDFTINAMAMSLNAEDFGKLFDPFEGMFDLQQGMIRVLHENSFTDDPTRILRCIRFAIRFGFTVQSETFQLLDRAVQEKSLNTVSGERLFQEIQKGCDEPNPYSYFIGLLDHDVLRHIDRELTIDGRTENHLSAVSSEQANFYAEYPDREWKTWLPYMMVLTADLPEESRDRISSKLRMPGIYARETRKLEASGLLDARNWQGRTEGVLSLQLKTLEPETLLYLFGRHGINVLLDFIRTFRHESVMLDGGDLLELGVELGPELGKLLDLLYEKRIDQQIASEEDEIEFVKRYLEKKSRPGH